jgi:hypothetical protein
VRLLLKARLTTTSKCVAGGHNCTKTNDGDPWYEVWNPPSHCAAWTSGSEM